MCHLINKKPDVSEYSKDDIDKAENCILSFFEWEKEHPILPILVEKPLVSEAFQFGGTLDLLAKTNGSLILIDFKTGKAIYKEMGYQLAAYRQLALENGHKISKAKILRIGRDEDEGFEEREYTNLDVQWEIFKACLTIYDTQKKEG